MEEINSYAHIIQITANVCMSLAAVRFFIFGADK